jgi:hypothetical protein
VRRCSHSVQRGRPSCIMKNSSNSNWVGGMMGLRSLTLGFWYLVARFDLVEYFYTMARFSRSGVLILGGNGIIELQ